MADREISTSEMTEAVEVVKATSWLDIKELSGDLVRGLWEEIPLFRLVLGTCLPLL